MKSFIDLPDDTLDDIGMTVIDIYHECTGEKNRFNLSKFMFLLKLNFHTNPTVAYGFFAGFVAGVLVTREKMHEKIDLVMEGKR